MNILEKYYIDHNENDSSFSRKSGLPQPTLWRIRNGKVVPQIKTALMIEKATNGEISAVELVFNGKNKAA